MFKLFFICNFEKANQSSAFFFRKVLPRYNKGYFLVQLKWKMLISENCPIARADWHISCKLLEAAGVFCLFFANPQKIDYTSFSRKEHYWGKCIQMGRMLLTFTSMGKNGIHIPYPTHDPISLSANDVGWRLVSRPTRWSLWLSESDIDIILYSRAMC